MISAATFHETFSGQNKREDMEKYMDEKFNRSQVASELADLENKFFIAYQDEKLVGYAKLREASYPEQNRDMKAIEIERIYVLKTYHHQKIGASLMQYCLDYSRDHFFQTIWLGVWELNPRAIRFYENWGFEKFGSHIFILGNDRQRDILMKKDLVA